jgi:hypothetical protein
MTKIPKQRTSPREAFRAVVQSEMALAKQAIATQADCRWLEDIKSRLPATWAKVSLVALTLDISSATVRAWVEQGLVIAVDYAARQERAAWTIYVPSLLEFLRKRQGGKQQ